MNSYKERPHIAIVDSNTLAVLGLKQLLQNVLPILKIDTYNSLAELAANHHEKYAHFFVSMNIVLEHIDFFREYRRKTIVLTMSREDSSQLKEFHSMCINVPEHELVRSLLMLEQHGHSHGKNLPEMPEALRKNILSTREIEVISLIVQGYINKEIAEKLHIGLATVVTHRKNIMDKLGFKSVSALTIYAVMHGYVDINKI
ncbi:helix-turn-helix transcriptional regulator [Xylanibacter brevis]|uniref:helix-turn-helix transcriptional regulator n=1 Tax=Xylanibacter brevis TaxID=83231 RepID=UPI00047FC7DF|nr:response regulator transcription factor [Xylanibacter brevis]